LLGTKGYVVVVVDFMQTTQRTNKNAVKWLQSLTEHVSHFLLGDHHQASGQKG
jgi:hypothetical protein